MLTLWVWPKALEDAVEVIHEPGVEVIVCLHRAVTEADRVGTVAEVRAVVEVSVGRMDEFMG